MFVTDSMIKKQPFVSIRLLVSAVIHFKFIGAQSAPLKSAKLVPILVHSLTKPFRVVLLKGNVVLDFCDKNI